MSHYTDEQGRKQAVVLPLDEFRRLVERLEDLEDRRVLAEREGEPRIDIGSLEGLLALVDAAD